MMTKTTRRGFLAGTASIGAAAAAGLRFPPLEAAEPQPLRIPALIDARGHANSVELKAQHGRTAFFGDRASATRGFNASYLGPTLRLHRGDEVEVSVTNAMRDATAVHWHGLLVPAELDGGPHQMVQPGATWRPRLKIDQPAATLWYHAHPHGSTARQVYAGLAGMIVVADEAERGLGLPSNYGVDDLPVILQDIEWLG
jgi:blue copper oxidase